MHTNELNKWTMVTYASIDISYIQVGVFECVYPRWTTLGVFIHIYESESVSRTVVSDFLTLWTVACQALWFMEFTSQEYWSGLLFPSPGMHMCVCMCVCVCVCIIIYISSWKRYCPGTRVFDLSWCKMMVSRKSNGRLSIS